MKKTKNRIFITIFLTLFIILFLFSCSKSKSNGNNELADKELSYNVNSNSNNNSTNNSNSEFKTSFTEIKWKEYDLLNNFSKDNDKFFMLFFYTDWCSYCKKMQQTTFKNTKIIELLNTYFISIKVNGESNQPLSKQNKNITGINLLSQFQITGFPTTVFFDKQGKPLTAIPGYLTEDIYIDILKYIYTESYLKETFDEFQKNQK